ncbi:amidase signature enzyme [Chiua virens]|nr:amidase signature enzyme [Chiua virens]
MHPPITRQIFVFAPSTRYLGSAICQRRSISAQAIHHLNDSVNALTHTSKTPHTTRPDGMLHGMTIAIKDNICTASFPTSCSSAMLAGASSSSRFVKPTKIHGCTEYTSPFDATAVELLQDAGAEIIGKANCDEFGMGSLNVNSIRGPVVNPHQSPDARDVPWTDRERRSAGGSSGGSAASVAAGMCTAALGTDTGGSIRLPASYCGVVGLKPSYGLVSRWGIVSFADSLDCVGVFAKSVDTVKEVFGVISVYDKRDPTTASIDLRKRASLHVESYLPQMSSRVRANSLGWSKDRDTTASPLPYAMSSEPSKMPGRISNLSLFQQRTTLLGSTGFSTVRSILRPLHPTACLEWATVLTLPVPDRSPRPPPPGVSCSKPSNVYAHTRSVGFGREVQKRILLGTYALTADAFDNYFLQAQRVRAYVKADFNKVFRHPCVYLAHPEASLSADGVDVLLHPSAIRTAPRLASKQDDRSDGSDASSLDEYLQDVMTVPASLAGLPALSVPIGLGEDGWPVGMSIVGQWGMDELVLRVGQAIESMR